MEVEIAIPAVSSTSMASFISLVAITLSGFGGLDGGENHEGKRREKEKDDIFLEGESSADRGCLQVSI